MRKVTILIADSAEFHATLLKGMLINAGKSDCEVDVVAICSNGKHALDQVKSLSPDMVCTEIRMPEMDGLTELLLLRKKIGYSGVVLMATAETQENISRLNFDGVSSNVKEMPLEKKLEHMRKIEERVIRGVPEEGKINNLLEGCEKLYLDPQVYAKSLGANGYLLKPFQPERVEKAFRVLLKI